jgi:hypothetical protein
MRRSSRASEAWTPTMCRRSRRPAKLAAPRGGAVVGVVGEWLLVVSSQVGVVHTVEVYQGRTQGLGGHHAARLAVVVSAHVGLCL